MNIVETVTYINKLPVSQPEKTHLAFLAGQGFTLEVLHEAFVKNGMNENSSIFYQAALELKTKFEQVFEDKDIPELEHYFGELPTLFAKSVKQKEARVSYLD